MKLTEKGKALLINLGQEEGGTYLTAREISDRSGDIHSNARSVSGSIRALVNKGLVDKLPAGDVMSYSITNLGREVLEDILSEGE